MEIKGKAFALAKKDKKDLNKAEKVALEGWPKLGNDTRAQIRVKESKEFKVSWNMTLLKVIINVCEL